MPWHSDMDEYETQGKWIDNNRICILPHLNAPYNHLENKPTSS